MLASDQAHRLWRIVLASGVECCLHHGGALAHQVQVAVQAKTQYRVGCQHIAPHGLALQSLCVRTLQKFQYRDDPRVLQGCCRKRLNFCQKRGLHLFQTFAVFALLVLLLAVFQLLSIGDAQHVFGVVPQQVGRHAGGLFDAHRHLENTAHFFLALQFARVAQLQQFALGGDFQNERDFLLLQPEQR